MPDVDHIAAIDNTVRKLVQRKRNSLGVGFYFSLVHSSVVLLMAIVTAFSVKWVQRELPQM
jgi:high-affinity nickel-transport protein